MSSTVSKGRIQPALRQFIDTEASGGVVLMAAATLWRLSPPASRPYPIDIDQPFNDLVCQAIDLLIAAN